MAVAGRTSEFGRTRPQRFASLTASARNLTASLAGFLGIPRSQNDNQPGHREPGPAVELDCLRHTLAPALLAAAEQRSEDIGVGADRVLIQWGAIEESAYLDHLAAHTGLDIETFEDVSRDDCLLPDGGLHLSARHGLLPIRQREGLVYVSAPHGYTARRVVRLIRQYPSLRGRIRLTSTACFNAFLEYHSGDALADTAAEGLARRFPGLSAAPIPASRGRLFGFSRHLLRLAAFVIPLVLAPLLLLDRKSVV